MKIAEVEEFKIIEEYVMSIQVPINIIATARTDITVNSYEELERLKDRCVDIYLHADGLEGYSDKADLGSSFERITVGKTPSMVCVDRTLFLALLDTAKRLTDLENIYDDKTETSVAWKDIYTLTSLPRAELEPYLN